MRQHEQFFKCFFILLVQVFRVDYFGSNASLAQSGTHKQPHFSKQTLDLPNPKTAKRAFVHTLHASSGTWATAL